MRRAVIVALLAGLHALAQVSTVSTWVASNAVPITTTQAGHGFADLQPLKSMIGDARIVALGEATHGTREFYEFHHRMLEFLASEMGFTTLSVEANMPEAYKLNDYVVRGQGDPVELLKGLHFWTLDTKEMLDIIHWMREFNQSGKGHLEFTGFDMQYTAAAAKNVGEFLGKYDPNYATIAQPMNDRAERTQPGVPLGVATATFPIEAARGKKIRFSGFIRTESVRGSAGLWCRVDGETGVLAFDNMHDRPVTGTTDWKEYSIELPVATDARNIDFGALFGGNGVAWFDDFKIELNGKPYLDSTQFDLALESPTPKGFYTGGVGYRVELDLSVFHGGKQSLRMQHVRLVDSNDAVNPAPLIHQLRDEILHMQMSRANYRRKGATDGEIDWAIQNARVIHQCLEVRADSMTRDQTMADNIKWISEQPAGTKVIVLAHNAHVRTAGESRTMGAFLRGMFGSQLVTFGLAFNQGSFRAVSQSSNLLTEFSVPPAQAGTLDAMLASAGLPRFVLDLHQLPKQGPVADWWKQTHDTRHIGTTYPENSPYALQLSIVAPDAYDALVFIATTTAAHGN